MQEIFGSFGGAPSFPFDSMSSWLQSSEASIWCQRQWKIVVNWWSLGGKKSRNRQWGPIVNWLGMYTKSYGMSQRSCLLSPTLSSSSLASHLQLLVAPMPLIVTFTKPLHTRKDLLQFLAVPSFSFSSAIWGAFQKRKTHFCRHSIFQTTPPQKAHFSSWMNENHPQEEITKLGYRVWEEKRNFSVNLAIFWWPVVTYCLNMTSPPPKKNPWNLTTLVPFLNKIPVSSHTEFVFGHQVVKISPNFSF